MAYVESAIATAFPFVHGQRTMGFIPGVFRGSPKVEAEAGRVPPGQYVTRDFPVLSAGPTPNIPLDKWRFTVSGQVDKPLAWAWQGHRGLPAAHGTIRLHPLTKWAQLGTRRTAVS